MERGTSIWQAALFGAAMTAGVAVANAQTAPAANTGGDKAPAVVSDGGNTGALPVYSADVEIEESIVDEHGAVVEVRPKTRYRMAVRRTARGLQTEIVYPEARLFPKGPLVDPRSGFRFVFGGDLASGRIYNATGAAVLGPAREASDGPDVAAGAASGLVLADRDLRTRRSDLVRRFGPALGRMAGRDRYLSSEGDLLTETFVEPATMLPVEVNVARGGALEHRTSIAYGRMPGGRWYVARTRNEMALPGQAGRRFVSDRTHLNVVSQEAR